MPLANSAKYYVSACAKDHKEKGIWIGIGRRASATSESGEQWWRWAGCSHSPVLSWGLVRGLKKGSRRMDWRGELRFRHAFGWQMAGEQVGVQRPEF